MSRRTRLRRRALSAVAPAALAALAAAGCRAVPATDLPGVPVAASATVDSAALLDDLARLADDSLRGRAAGTPENARARAWIAARFDRLGLATVGEGRVPGASHRLTR